MQQNNEMMKQKKECFKTCKQNEDNTHKMHSCHTAGIYPKTHIDGDFININGRGKLAYFREILYIYCSECMNLCLAVSSGKQFIVTLHNVFVLPSSDPQNKHSNI
jgi:hypothetical protein